MRYVTIAVWWAGHKLKTEETPEEEISETIEEWQRRLDAKEIHVSSVGVHMNPVALCIDIVSSGTLISQHDLKRQ